MKVAVISYHTCPYEAFGLGFSGGMNVFLKEVAERLSLIDVSIEIFTRSPGDDFTTLKNENLRVHHIGCGLPKSPGLSDYLEKEELFCGKVLRMMRGGGGLIFSNYWLSAGTALRGKTELAMKVVHMNHTLELVKEKFSGSSYGSQLLRQSRLFREYYVQKLADHLIFPSGKDLEVSASLYPWIRDKGTVIEPGISEEFLDSTRRGEGRRALLGIPDEETVFLFGGRDERTKNLKGLISAFVSLKDKRSWLVLSGGGTREEGDRIKCVSPRDRESLVSLVDLSDCVVVPSYYESFGIFAMETLARGKPLIVSEGTFLGDLVSEGGFGEVFAPRGERTLRDAMRSFIGKREIYRERAGEIALKSREFTWERASFRFRQLLDRLY